MNSRYIVVDKNGVWQASYSFGLGRTEAFRYAKLTAKHVNGTIYEQINDGEIRVYTGKE